MSTHDEASVRAEVRAWLQQHWDIERSLVAWRGLLADSGWGMPHWPRAWYGRDLPVALLPVVEEEFESCGAVGVARIGIRLLAAATLLEHGNDSHKSRFLRRILTGEDSWCQLFSEPGSGSDLAGATTRADNDGEGWGGKRAEAVDHQRSSCRVGLAARAHRLGRAETYRHVLLHHRHDASRH